MRLGSQSWWGKPLAMSRRRDIETALRRLAPRMPRHELAVVVDQATDSRGLRTASPEAAGWLALVAYVRHRFTDYDQLLEEGYDVDSARFFVLGDMNVVLESWGVRRRLTSVDA
jgi:hypothetical protein